MAVAALACGAASVALWVLLTVVPIPGAALLLVALPIVAIVLGLVARRDPNATQSGRTLALVGLILGIVQLSFAALALLVAMMVCIACSRNSSGRSGGCCPGCGCGDGCASCGEGCGSCGEGCSSCGDGCNSCGDGCSSCGDGCGSCGDGCSSCGDGCGSCGDGCSCSAAQAAPCAVGLVVAPRRLRGLDLAHHPDHPDFDADVFRVRGHRLCVGCFTTFPTFLAASAALTLWPLAAPTHAPLALGLALASLQGVSAAGLARRRWVKAAVKLALGSGLAVAVHAVLASGWPPWLQAGALGAFLALASLSAWPRSRRLERWASG